MRGAGGGAGRSRGGRYIVAGDGPAAAPFTEGDACFTVLRPSDLSADTGLAPSTEPPTNVPLPLFLPAEDA